MAETDKLNIDNIIARLLEVRGGRPGKNVQLTEVEIRGLCLKSRKIFLSQPIFLELEALVKICGDIHGQYYDLLRQLVTLFSAPNYCGEFGNAGAMMSVDETLMCSLQILKPADKRKFIYGSLNAGRPVALPRGANNENKKK